MAFTGVICGDGAVRRRRGDKFEKNFYIVASMHDIHYTKWRMVVLIFTLKLMQKTCWKL